MINTILEYNFKLYVLKKNRQVIYEQKNVQCNRYEYFTCNASCIVSDIFSMSVHPSVRTKNTLMIFFFVDHIIKTE